jgi:hypothetical protein
MMSEEGNGKKKKLQQYQSCSPMPTILLKMIWVSGP